MTSPVQIFARRAAWVYGLAVIVLYFLSPGVRDLVRTQWPWVILIFGFLVAIAVIFRPTLELGKEYPDPTEQKTINDIINLLIFRLKKQYAAERTLRDTHPKSNGLIKAKFEILDNQQDDRLRGGLFATPATYDCWIRFSNAADKLTADKERDFRGIGIKLVGLDGDKLQDDEKDTVDFMLLGAEKFFAKHPDDFLSFFSHVTYYPELLGTLFYFIPLRLRQFWNTITGRKSFGHLLEIDWFSVVPFRFGDKGVVKYHIPGLPETHADPGEDENYLRDRMTESLNQEKTWVLEFQVQFQEDPHRHPIENALKAWDSDLHTVAKIHIPKQNFNTPERLEFDENMIFNPWHCTPDHRPLGGINRARRDIMRAIQEHRLAANNTSHSDVGKGP